MVKNYKSKLNDGYTPPPPTGTPLYHPEEEAEIPPKRTNIPPRRMNPPPMNSVPPQGINRPPMNQGYQQYNQPRFNQPNYNNPQFNQSPMRPFNNGPQYGAPPQYGSPQFASQSPGFNPNYYPNQNYQRPMPQLAYNRNNSYPPAPNNANGPVVPPRRDRYDTSFVNGGGQYYSDPSYRMPFPK
ncbi:hypothetical protein H8356DRAFT_1618161 [Neocallimastix lanati (nom. inval.)]|jgi:hypothetical protein|uniref:Uncharacterized protein n=1 Tax=Neocallimastix californiae TaxID=1754190 RepID=A0A1Y2B451_9FUNG|nr:hypothetical protein H8356DRAFT_1742885 [Neocallimastix sp. JGI-2020a]KAG4108839.1 hypothetical protein H8356DRAFT_1618161 [Neocallimastix sp. JGI-2020a]ORY29609.1 hypothetical protein LY90DRAFT_83827 [Neocallimastix californiae]|eukprot:ORY29609.1 hypothetical protein LY90DRAFT_83827 [Neocallimastix californiae]